MMSNKQRETNDVNESRLAEQGFQSDRYSQQGKIGHQQSYTVINKRRNWPSQKNKIFTECYLLSQSVSLKHKYSKD